MNKNFLRPLIFLFCLSACLTAHAQEKPSETFLVLTIDNKIIGPVINDYIGKGIEKARTNNYEGVIILLDTPGGLLESTRSIVKKIMNSPVPVITYISPSGSRAGSAGVFITLASHVAAMAPSTNIGAAHPVEGIEPRKDERSLKKAVEELTEALRSQKKQKKTGTKKQETPENTPSESPMEDKVLNDTVAWVETIARNRGRNAEWAKLAVVKSISVDENKALEQKVIDLIAQDTSDLLKKMDGRMVQVENRAVTLKSANANLVDLDLTPGQEMLNTLINPNIAYILMMIGFLGLFIELIHPGAIFPGIAGLISLVLAFYAFAVLPVNFAGFLFIGLAIIFLIAEILTPASFGLLTLAGIISMILGSLMLIDASFSGLYVSLNVILPIAMALTAIVLFLMTNVLRAHKKKVMTGAESMPGTEGKAETDILVGGEGQVFASGEVWSAINTGKDPISKGEKIKVVGVDKIKLLVTK